MFAINASLRIAACQRQTGLLQDLSVIRDVRVEDMGHKMGCNGVDNGKLWFDGEDFLPSKYSFKPILL